MLRTGPGSCHAAWKPWALDGCAGGRFDSDLNWFDMAELVHLSMLDRR